MLKINRIVRVFYYDIVCQVIGIVSYPFFYIIKVRFLNINITRIGHLSSELDCYIKEGLIGMRPKYHAIVIAPHNMVANVHLLSYWERYVTFITSPVLRILLDPFWHNNLTMYDVQKYVSVFDKHAGFIKIQNEYFGRPSLISLNKIDYNCGWELLQKLGINKSDWFICIHCREEGYISGEGSKYRNADIDNYIFTIKTIVEMGGWVIRMGDSTMKKIPSMEHVIDYAHLDIKSDWMDIFLCASCKLFLGGASGLRELSEVFNIPVVVVNASPISVVLSSRPNDICIPKLVWSIKENRYLSFKEVFNSPISNFFYDYFYYKAGVKLIDNSPDDIKEATIERLDIIENKITYTDKDEQLQSRFKSLITQNHYSYGSKSRIGKDFLRKYEHLLAN